MVCLGTSQAVQWLRLHASTAGAQIRSLVRELRYHKPQNVAKKKKYVCITFAIKKKKIFTALFRGEMDKL